MLWHITTTDQWSEAGKVGVYRTPSLETEGFVHCSALDQVIGTAHLWFAGQTGLILLGIDEALLDVTVIWEDLYGSGQEFPHVYGAIPLRAVTTVLDLPCTPDGAFTLPDGT